MLWLPCFLLLVWGRETLHQERKARHLAVLVADVQSFSLLLTCVRERAEQSQLKPRVLCQQFVWHSNLLLVLLHTMNCWDILCIVKSRVCMHSCVHESENMHVHVLRFHKENVTTDEPQRFEGLIWFGKVVKFYLSSVVLDNFTRAVSPDLYKTAGTSVASLILAVLHFFCWSQKQRQHQ